MLTKHPSMAVALKRNRDSLSGACCHWAHQNGDRWVVDPQFVRRARHLSVQVRAVPCAAIVIRPRRAACRPVSKPPKWSSIKQWSKSRKHGPHIPATILAEIDDPAAGILLVQ